MTDKKTSDAQLRASRKWQDQNKEQMKHVRNRSGAKGYIRNATFEELEELEQLIAERKKALSDQERAFAILPKRRFIKIGFKLVEIEQVN